MHRSHSFTSEGYPDYAVALTISREPKVDVSDQSLGDNCRASLTTNQRGWYSLLDSEQSATNGSDMRDADELLVQIDPAPDGPLPSDPTHWEGCRVLNFGDAGLGFVFV